MTTDFAIDYAVKALKERIRKLELSVARNKPAGGISVTDGSGAAIPPLTGTDLATVINELLVLIEAAEGLVTVTDGVVTVSPATTMTVPLGGVIDLGGENADLQFLTDRYGSQHAVVTDATVTSSYEFDLSQGNWFDLTLTGNVTSSTIINPPPNTGEFYVILRQGGAGSFTFVWPAEIDWQDTDGTGGGSAPTLHTAFGAVNVIGWATVDGGTSFGAWDEAGGSSDPALGGDLSGTASAAVVEAVQGVVVTDAGTTGDVLTKTGALTATWQTPASPTTHFEPVQFDDGSAEWPLVYFNGELVMTEVPN